MSDLVFKAITFAAQCHEGQYRKGTSIPYIVHPLSMLRFLARLDAPAELQAAAVLHDVVEDTEATLEDIEQRFGGRVAALVEGATEKDKTLSWLERKQAAIHHAECSSDLELLVLKCVDKLDNLSDIREDHELHGETIWGRFKVDRATQMWYYGTLTRLFGQRLIGSPYQGLAAEMASVYESVFGPLPEQRGPAL
jgi:(p)ppGpp synthase/HD superfamily hydrolase